MPRTARAIVENHCYHVLNRANQRARVFHSPDDYAQFCALISRAQDRLELPILSACLMPNHIHLVVRPCDALDLSRWTHWVFTTHVRWYHQRYESTGRVWQGRFKAFPVYADQHLLTVMRYVERNAVRAKLVERAEDWEWGSLAWRRGRPARVRVADSPVPLPSYWRHWVNEPQTDVELAELRACANRGRPFGPAEWVKEQARHFGLESTLHSVGRPRKARRVPSRVPIC